LNVRANPTKAKLRSGQVAVGTLCTTSSALMAEALGYAGFDFLIVDLQHGESNLGDLQKMLQAVSASPATPLVRIPANMPVYVQRALDIGAYGVVAPLVDMPDEARALVQSVHYGPRGMRSWGPVRGVLYGGSDYFAQSAGELLTIAMLETASGLEHAREILELPGIDGCFIGPNDLSIALGFAPELQELPEPVERAIAKVLSAAQVAGKVAGIQVYSVAAANRRIHEGFRFISIQSDLRMARASAGDLLRGIHR